MAKDAHIPIEDYYTILNLSTRKLDPNLTPSEVKAAYKRALLKHHPDKNPSKTAAAHTPSSDDRDRRTGSAITIDSIALAYKILSSPSLKSSYDAGLRTSNNATNEDDDKVFRTGLDSVDLDDLVFDEAREVWTRACRCGDDRGFVVTEGELEGNLEDGELIVGCRGCSLWLRVLFGVEEG